MFSTLTKDYETEKKLKYFLGGLHFSGRTAQNSRKMGFARRICREFKTSSIGGSEAIVKTHTPHVCRGSSLNFGGGAFYLNNPCEKETD